MVLVIGRESAGLYLFKPHIQFTTLQASFTLHHQSMLWHRLLGHASIQALGKIESHKSVFFQNKCVVGCQICPLAKQHMLSFPNNTFKFFLCFSTDSCGCLGPYHKPTYDNKRYFLTTVHDFTKNTWTYLIAFKSGVIVIIKHFLVLVKNQFNTFVKMVRADNGVGVWGDGSFSMINVVHYLKING